MSRAEGGSVDIKGKIDHWSARTKVTKEESEEPRGTENEKQEKEMKVDEATLHEASAEVESLKRRVIRVESEETQDNVRETLAISQEEAEEMGFVPSAPRAINWCDNRCSEKGVGYWQIASMVIEEGGKTRTVNLCQQC